MNRNQFFRGVIGTGVFAFASPLTARPLHKDDQLSKELVKEFVSVSHKDINQVKPLLEEYPTLLNAAHDWGGGDFETGLGAASHVGNKQLVEYFLKNGAQTNIFTACLFGELNIVKACLEAFPLSLNAKGPHGYTLLHHAELGGEQALEVKEFLSSLGLSQTIVPLF